MNVRLTAKERWQLEQLLDTLNNPYESIAKRRLAKTKFDVIYHRAVERSADEENEELEKSNVAVCMYEGEKNPSN
ncbi:hypothetical protein GLW08_09810 [Pontibacillus yanchengensis]|uniref:Uncharacterized protein n=2 Tax=Pontibacillus yanchengensis TaxID=462910 RepID=A0ACC7VG19_9BACI|nr:hypothetical protein [Pontibacillus yanchengensis]MYL33575.1 hypothetical protein [Pontibacillus yanchengensis]MYL53630.1 hypothetical protein [Pontibacillus yanchengensis]